MRRAIDSKILYNEENEAYAIFMGAGFCAEHEWGIGKLKRSLGISLDNSILGIKQRKISKSFPYIRFLIDKRKNEACVLAFSEEYLAPDEKKTNTVHRVKKYYDLEYVKDKVISAWDGSSFCIIVKGTKDVNFLDSLYKDALKKEVALFLYSDGIDNPFNKFGLLFSKVKNFDKNIQEEMLYHDELEYNLDKERKKILNKYPELESININIQFKWAENHLRVSRESQMYDLATDYSLVVKVSHMMGQELNTGIFSIEETLDYIKGKGPILKTEFKKWLKEYNKSKFLKEAKKNV